VLLRLAMKTDCGNVSENTVALFNYKFGLSVGLVNYVEMLLQLRW
jgi:hypothetical protein